MMMKVALVLMLATLARCQRPSFAGSRPIGYPEITTTEGLADRFGEVDGTTQRLPIEANGDRDLVDRLSKLPIDKQPFWFINWQAYEANRQKPQTYPQKPNPFINRPQNNQANAAGNFANAGNVGVSSSLGNSGANFNSGNLGTSGTLGSNNRHGSTNINSASASVPNSNSNAPSVANRISETASTSANKNSVDTGNLEDRFSGGIELNRYQETVASNSGTVNHKPGNTVSANYYNKQYYYSR